MADPEIYTPNCGWSTSDPSFALPKSVPSLLQLGNTAMRSVIFTKNMATDGIKILSGIQVKTSITPPFEGAQVLNVFLDLWVGQKTTYLGGDIVDQLVPLYGGACRVILHDGYYQKNLSLTDITYQVDRIVYSVPPNAMVPYATKVFSPLRAYAESFNGAPCMWVLTVDNYSPTYSAASIDAFELTLTYSDVPAAPPLVPKRSFKFPLVTSALAATFKGHQDFQFLHAGVGATGLMEGCRVARIVANKLKQLRISGTNTGSAGFTDFQIWFRRGSSVSVLFDTQLSLPSGAFNLSVLSVQHGTFDIQPGDILFVTLGALATGARDIMVTFEAYKP